MTNIVELAIPTPGLPLTQVRNVVEFVNTFDVCDATTQEIASAEYAEMRELYKIIEAKRTELKRPIIDAGKGIDDFFRPALSKLEVAGQLLARKLAAYHDAQQEKLMAEQAKAREEQRKRDEAIAREAAEREALAQAEAARLRREAETLQAAGSTNAAEELAMQAERVEMAGQQDAQQLLERAQSTMPLPLPEVSKSDNISTREQWYPECVDLGETVVAVAEGKAPLKVLDWNLTVLRQMVTALKGEFNVPGVIARRRTAIAAKAKR